MKASSRHRAILRIIETDRTFERQTFRDHEVWSGKCLHCNAILMVALSGEPISRATIEHIVPKSAGGTDDPLNLGLACARCNAQKGKRHDPKYKANARAQEVVAALLEKRRSRMP